MSEKIQSTVEATITAGKDIQNNRGALSKAAIAKHASEIFTSLPNKQALTDGSVAGLCEMAVRSIELAELFHDILESRGYDGADR